ncbi:MAG TPA: hypothetical protein VMU77_05735 [Acidimicrobiales bacterium]|nr:hypothetical protein [Acidimicrobiales bacterium]
MGKIIQAVDMVSVALEASHLPFGFGGGLAVAYYGTPRATSDVDVGIFVDVSNAQSVADAVSPIAHLPTTFVRELETDGVATADVFSVDVDCFLATNPIHTEMAERLRWVPFGKRSIPIISPEDFIIIKAIFDRDQDWIDIESVISIGPQLSEHLVYTWLLRAGRKDARSSSMNYLWLVLPTSFRNKAPSACLQISTYWKNRLRKACQAVV